MKFPNLRQAAQASRCGAHWFPWIEVAAIAAIGLLGWWTLRPAISSDRSFGLVFAAIVPTVGLVLLAVQLRRRTRALAEAEQRLGESERQFADLQNQTSLLRTSERQYRELVETSSDLIWSMDALGRATFVNEAARRLFGYEPSEVIGHSFTEFIAPAHIEKDLRAFARVLQGEPDFHHETQLLHRDGHAVDVINNAAPLYDAQGCVIGATGTATDLTQRKKVEEALRQSEAMLLLAQRIGRIGSWEADFKLDGLTWSAETYRIFGVKRREFIVTTESFYGLVHPADRALVRQATQSAIHGGSDYRIEYRVCRPDGTVRYVTQQALVLRDPNGAPQKIVGTVQDVTDQKESEQTVRESELRFRTLFEQSPDAVFVLDPDNRRTLLPIVDCNDAACAQHGFTRAELIGQSFLVVNPHVRSRRQIDGFLHWLRLHPSVPVETTHRRKDGSTFSVESRAALLRVSGRQLLLGLCRDVTERKQVQRAIEALNDDLERRVAERTAQLKTANEELEAFSFSVSHDLRAPLRTIAASAQKLLGTPETLRSAESQKPISAILQTSRRMSQLIDDLLCFSRVNRQTLRHGPVSVQELVQEVLTELLTASPRPTARVIEGALPTAWADASLLRQVWTNLLSNALKFSRPRAEAQVEFGGHEADGEIVFFVRDNGVGFDMRQAAQLGQAFHRLHATEEFEGAGLGLALVQRIVQRHGGRLWYEAAVNHGATFRFSLPAAPRTVAKAERVPAVASF